MKKSSTSFVCQECGYDSPQWLGKCPECGQWNSFKEFQVSSKFPAKRDLASQDKIQIIPKTLDKIQYLEKDRLLTGFSEVDLVLGGGLVRGSVTLLAGDPGVGKSTLLLQIALTLAISRQQSDGAEVGSPRQVLYISGEESEEQIKLRAQRINNSAEGNNFLLISTNSTETAINIIEKIKPGLVIVDSIQTMESENVGGLSGSIPQIRYSTSSFVKTAKSLGIPVIIIGHVTKEGMVAGPMMLSHMVDTVLFLEGEKFTNTRLLRGLKNRFGPVDEVGIFVMEEKGLSEIKNPEHIFLTDTKNNAPGSILSATMEGSRIFIVEIQSLVVATNMPIPRRVAAGFDSKRLELLLAVLQKHCRLPLAAMDVFVNVAGGLKLSDPGVDLAVCLSIFSSMKNIPLSDRVAIAEVGLLGELRVVYGLDKRVREAKKLGFTKIISSKDCKSISQVIEAV